MLSAPGAFFMRIHHITFLPSLKGEARAISAADPTPVDDPTPRLFQAVHLGI